MRIAAILLLAVALAGCGSHQASPESVARAWSTALNRNDNQAAAKLFAPGAQIVQTGVLLTLRTHAQAVTWNAGLPCGGRIANVQQQSRDQVLVIFSLTDRPGHQCDGPGDAAAALFTVVHGKIVLWHETAVPNSNAV
jgi:hypothetical protein